MRKPLRRSKIVCTLGPSVGNLDAIVQLIEAGMDVARVNFSHGTHEQHAQTIKWVREASEKLQIPVAILGDLQGPKIRTGKIVSLTNDDNGRPYLPLIHKQPVFFKGSEPRDIVPGQGTLESPLYISYPRLAVDLKAGDKLLIEDGLIRMSVKKVHYDKSIIECDLDHGEKLGENKGVNMPGARLSTLGVTEKDWEDILFGINQEVDFFALSFVRSAREIKSLKTYLEQKGAGIHVIAKIEKSEAIENIDEILFHSDGLMVARGDLGVEIGNEHVPVVQKRLIRKAREAGKPVITATQMLMSMVENPSPSRAEASDVANAVLDGSDALMLSNETASGKFPIEAVKTMSTIILGAEGHGAKDLMQNGLEHFKKTGRRLEISEAVEAAAVSMAESLHARCLACLTRSGQAARLLAKYRPAHHIYAFAENVKVQKQLCLCWGISVVPWKETTSQDYSVFDDFVSHLAKLNLVGVGELTVMTAGIPTSLKVGTTNTIVVRQWNGAKPS